MTKKHVIIVSFLSLMFITGCANRESKTTNIDTTNTGTTISNTEGSGTQTPQEIAITCHQDNTCFIIPFDNTRTREFHIFDKHNLAKPLYSIKLPEDSSGYYISWGPYYAGPNAKFINDKVYVIGHRTPIGGPEQNVDNYVFEISKDGSVHTLGSIGKNIGDSSSRLEIDQKNKKIVTQDVLTNTLKLFDLSTDPFKISTYDYILKENEYITMILSLENTTIEILTDVGEKDFIGKEAKVVTIDMSGGKILSTIPYTQYKKPTQGVTYKECQIGEECTLLVNGKVTAVPEAYSGLSFTTLIDDKDLLGYNMFGGYSFVDLQSIK